MSDFILLDGDTVNFMPAFPPANVVIQPGKIDGTGKETLDGKPVCVEGDENSVSVPGCTYVAPPYVIPGIGTLKIDSLGSDQTATKTYSGGKPVLLKGTMFTAKFEVQSPAQQPPSGSGSPIPDSRTSYTGKGTFMNSNMKWTGT